MDFDNRKNAGSDHEWEDSQRRTDTTRTMTRSRDANGRAERQETPRQEYHCQCEGCPNGKGSTFEDYHAEHWLNNPDPKKRTLPKNCFDCRDFNRRQTAIGKLTYHCKWCMEESSFLATFRISYNKYTGDWDEYWEKNAKNQACARCTANPGRSERFLRRRRANELLAYFRTEERRGKRGDLQSVMDEGEKYDIIVTNCSAKGYFGDVETFDVPSDVEFYKAFILKGSRRKHGKNAYEHIMKEKHEWDELGNEDAEIVIQGLANLAAKAGEGVAMFRTGHNKVVKVDIRSGLTVLLEPHRGGWVIETGWMTTGDMEERIAKKTSDPNPQWHR